MVFCIRGGFGQVLSLLAMTSRSAPPAPARSSGGPCPAPRSVRPPSLGLLRLLRPPSAALCPRGPLRAIWGEPPAGEGLGSDGGWGGVALPAVVPLFSLSFFSYFTAFFLLSFLLVRYESNLCYSRPRLPVQFQNAPCACLVIGQEVSFPHDTESLSRRLLILGRGPRMICAMTLNTIIIFAFVLKYP